MNQLVRRLPWWAIHVWIVLSIVIPLGVVISASMAGIALHRENQMLSDKVEQSEQSIDQLAVVNRAQDRVLAKANQKLKRLGENPVRSPFPFTFAFPLLGTVFTVTCAEPGEDCLVQQTEENSGG